MSDKHILVTGANHSGTTWIGKTLARSPDIFYIHEPFHLDYGPMTQWSEYIASDDPPARQALFERYFRELLNFGWKDLVDGLLPGVRLSKVPLSWSEKTAKWKRPRKLLKDPIAIMSADWLADKLDLDVVVCYRHPAAFAGSVKVRQHPPRIQIITDQQKLVADKLGPFQQQLHDFLLTENKDLIDFSILMWNVQNWRVRQYMEAYPHWTYLCHETISADPQQQFRNLFQKLGIPFLPSTQQFIHESTTSDEGYEKTSFESMHRHSVNNIHRWKERLTPEEVERVYEGTKELAAYWYEEDSWQ